MLSPAQHTSVCHILTFLTSQDRNYAIYGVGQVGRGLLDIIRSGGYKEPSFFLDDASPLDNVDGIKVVRPGNGQATNVQEVILGTTCFQKQMRATVERVYPSQVRCIDIVGIPVCTPSHHGSQSSSHVPQSPHTSDDYEYGWTLDKAYFARQTSVIDSIKRKLKFGTGLDDALQGFDGTSYGERVAEYPYATQWLKSFGRSSKLLDIGCVLNNDIVSTELKAVCREVWFCNPAPERNNLGFPTFYHLANIQNARFRGGSFDLVSCLSTIEHIGFDNSQYGDTSEPLYSEPTDQPLLDSLASIVRWLKPGGRFLVSVPFGKRQVCQHRHTKKKAFQQFNYQSVMNAAAFVKDIGGSLSARVYQGTNTGWIPVERPGECTVPYAHGFPGAAAVAIFDGQKLR